MFEKCSDERRDSISVIQSVKNKIVILKTVEYRISSNKRPGAYLKLCAKRVIAYSRGRLLNIFF